MPARNRPAANVTLAGVPYHLARNPESGDLTAVLPGAGATGSWTEVPIQIFPQRQLTGRTTYSIYPPEDEAVWEIATLARGAGLRLETIDEPTQPSTGRYYYSSNIDASLADKIVLSPELRTATVSGITNVLKFFSYGDGNTYALAVDTNADGHVIRTTGDPAATVSGSTPTWTDQQEFPSADNAETSYPQTSVAVFYGTNDSAARAYIGAASGHAYMHAVAPATTITEHAGSEPARAFAVVGDELWRAEVGSANVSLTRDGGATPIWGSNIVVGEATQKITALVAGLDGTDSNRLYVIKTDGLYTIGVDSTTFDQELTPQWHGRYDPDAGMANVFWREHIWFRFENAIWAYHTRTGGLTQIGPERLDGNDQLNGEVTALGHDDHFLYAAITATGDSVARLWKGKPTFAGSGLVADIAWHPILDVGEANVAVNDIYYTRAASGRNPALLLALDNGSIGHITLPRGSPDPTADSNCRYQSEGSIYLSRFDSLPGENKVFVAVDMTASAISGTETIAVLYRTDSTSAFARLDTWDSPTADVDGARKGWDQPVTDRFLELRYDFSRNAGSPEDTPILHRSELRFAFRPTTRWIYRMALDLSSRAPRRGGGRSARYSASDLKAEIRALPDRGVVVLVTPDEVERAVFVRQDPRIFLVSAAEQKEERWIAFLEAIDVDITVSSGTWARAGFDTWAYWSTDIWTAIGY